MAVTQGLYKLMFQEYPDVVSIKEMCEMLGGISVKTGYHLLHEGKIKYMKVGNSYKIPKVYIFEYLGIDLP